MPHPFAGITAGMLAGAAGATALSAATLVDQAVRGRPLEDTPKQTAARLAEVAGIDVPGGRREADVRLEGIGPLAGLAVGVGVGAAAGLLRGLSLKVPKPLAAVAVGLAAMALSDTVMTALGVTDPRKWTAQTIASDALPHLAYGLITTGALHRFLDPSKPLQP